MPDFIATSPDGRKFKITAPEGATPEEMADYAQKNMANLPSVSEPEKKKVSTGLDTARSIGSGMAEGAVDVVPGTLDILKKAGEYLGTKAANAVTGRDEQPAYAPSLTNSINKALHIDYDPRTLSGQYAKTISSFIPAMAAGNPSSLTSLGGIGKLLGAAGVSGGASETAGQITKNTPYEPYARMIGGMLPSSAIVPGAQAITKGILRGGAEPAEIEQNASMFDKSGTTPSLGQATESGVSRSLESLLSKLPGSSGVMKNFAQKQASDIGQNVDQTAAKLAPSASSAAAGRAIQNDIEGIFKPAVQKTQRKLYEDLDALVPGNTMVNVGHTQSMLDELTAPIKNATNLSQNKILQTPGIESIKEDFAKDMAGKAPTQSSILNAEGKPISSQSIPPRTTMPYEALKDLRTKINAKIQSFSLEPDVRKADLKRLAGAITRDMSEAVQELGPKAVEAFKKANAYTKQLHEDLDQLEAVVNKHGGEKVFDAALEGSNKGDSTIRTVMKALPDKTKGLFSAAVIKRMGKASPSNQNDIGDVFSTETFLTNWNRLSPGAKSALFDGYGAGFSRDMERIAKVASNIREGSGFFKNPSGTAPAEGIIHAANNLGAEVLSKLMVQKNAAQWFTNPKTVHWLAEATKLPKSAAPAAIASLNNIIKGKDDKKTSDSEKQKAQSLKMMISPQANQQIPQTVNIQ